MKKILILVYGFGSYLIFLVTILYAIGFVGNWLVPKSIDSGEGGPFWPSVGINLVLLSLFAIQHTVMARPAFKRWITKTIPDSAERSTFVLLSSLILLLIFWLWQPLPSIVWEVEAAAFEYLLIALSITGWVIVFYSTFLIDHFDLFGVRQVVYQYRGLEYQPPSFQIQGLYRWVRHPLMLGFLLAFWSTPTMTWGHLLFAVVTTAYIFFGITMEERDLLRHFGNQYGEYRQRTSMIFPRPPREIK